MVLGVFVLSCPKIKDSMDTVVLEIQFVGVMQKSVRYLCDYELFRQ